MNHWYAINAKPHQERNVSLHLEKLGLETFCPQLKQDKLIRRRMQTAVSPLFPGYLFARFDVERDYRSVAYTRGVRRIVSFGSAWAAVDEELIEGIRSRLREGFVVIPARVFEPGEVVRIQSGPLRGLEAVFERRMPDSQRVVLLLRALSFQARIVVDGRQLVNG